MDEKTKPEEYLALLKEKLSRLMPAPARFEAAIPGLMLSRFDEDTPASKCFYFPIAALIVQGYKRSMIGSQEVNYGEGYCMVVGVDMPGVYQISNVTPEKPFLSLSIRLDRRIISQLITEMPSLISSNRSPPLSPGPGRNCSKPSSDSWTCWTIPGESPSSRL